MDLKGNCQIVKMDSFSEEDQSYLHLLYFPLLKNDALFVYQILLSLAYRKEKYDQSFVISLTSFSESRFEKARKKLEDYKLLMTYYDPSTKMWLYQLYPPLNAHQFLTHDTFSRLYLRELGSKHFDHMKALFHVDDIDTTNMINVSSSLDLSSLDNWNKENEDVYLKLRPKEEDALKHYPFDFNKFLNGMDRTIPQRVRSAENLSRIAELASIYGVDEMKMRTYVIQCFEDDKSRINFETLRGKVMRSRNGWDIKQGHSMAPVRYFSMKQKDVPVSQRDKEIIESLCVEYKFPYEVVNVLIDYVLEKCHQQFPKTYVEKVAATWVRLGVDSEDKALEQTKNTYSFTETGTTVQLPNWFNQNDNTDANDVLEQALRAQASLKED